MPQDFDHYEKYDRYERDLDPALLDRQAHRARKVRVKHRIRRTQREIVQEMADATAIEAGFDISYRPARHEAIWLRQSIEPFFSEGLITDVLAQIKGGKEASVYLCQANPDTGAELLAAKVYRPRQFRNLRNDKVYRQGREVLLASGGTLKKNDHREMRAIGKKSAFGLQLRHSSWLLYEYQTLETLFNAGAAVPKPWSAAGNAILMDYIGDRDQPAPTMNHVRLDAAEARRLYGVVRDNMELMLEHDMVHGDLSPYNLLYWQGEVTLIDFPQVINLFVNKQAHAILARDIGRICEYFAQQGVICDHQTLMGELWQRYTGTNRTLLELPEELFAADPNEYGDDVDLYAYGG